MHMSWPRVSAPPSPFKAGNQQLTLLELSASVHLCFSSLGKALAVGSTVMWVFYVSPGQSFTKNLFPLALLADGSVPTSDFYRPHSGKEPLVPKYSNSLSVLLVLKAIKMQLWRPGFFEVHDTIILMDQELTGGENF
ncbi:hypothetical protein DFH08DRAFT_965366 [Mycena albidolilacea]|uniref:Uncharacterized protein n=1 Tax=Mycena albidolilacea TaxID=1033008 RepID=A0AAD6ZQJ2_9AGAR|nr:hypothetical protein DFH08DRAFT_965366 [Mycena albidolilacea]